MWIKVVFISVSRVLETRKPMILQSQGQSERRQLAREKYAQRQPLIFISNPPFDWSRKWREILGQSTSVAVNTKEITKLPLKLKWNHNCPFLITPSDKPATNCYTWYGLQYIGFPLPFAWQCNIPGRQDSLFVGRWIHWSISFSSPSLSNSSCFSSLWSFKISFSSCFTLQTATKKHREINSSRHAIITRNARLEELRDAREKGRQWWIKRKAKTNKYGKEKKREKVKSLCRNLKAEITGRKATALPLAKATKPWRVTRSTHRRKKNSSENGLKFKQWSNKAMKSLVKTPALKQRREVPKLFS